MLLTFSLGVFACMVGLLWVVLFGCTLRFGLWVLVVCYRWFIVVVLFGFVWGGLGWFGCVCYLFVVVARLL